MGYCRKVLLEFTAHRLYCRNCHCRAMEHISFLSHPQARLPRSLELTILELCSHLSIQAAANYFHLRWHTVKPWRKRICRKDTRVSRPPMSKQSASMRSYRNKDLSEKAFGNLEERLDMRRTAVFSSENLEGKLFVQFVALIFLSCIHKVMKDHEFYRHYSMQTLLDELDLIERFDYLARKWQCGEVTKKQADLYAAFSVTPPNML